MIDLEQAKKQVEEIADHFRAFQGLNRIDSDELLTINRDLIEEVEQKDIVLSAWQSIFGTSQLSHAQARLESAEREVERLKGIDTDSMGFQQRSDAWFAVASLLSELDPTKKILIEEIEKNTALRKETERLEQRWGESVDLVSEVEERAQKAERQVCQLRGALELILPHARDYVGKHEVGSNRRYVEIAEQALASTSRCGHKEHDEAYQKVVKAFESGADGILALVNEIIEQRGMKDWLTFNAKHGPNCMPDQFCDCGLKELLK